MKLNISFKTFKNNHIKKKHQVLFKSRNCKKYFKVENLFKFLLAEKNSFIFESVEKGKIKGRFTIIGLNPDKIWDVNKDIITINKLGKKSKIKTNPLNFINKLIKDFDIKIPKNLPSMSSMLVGYFSYDIIRYIEQIPDKCIDDLKIPDIRLSRPKNLVIYDNLKKKIFYIENVYADTKISDYNEAYDSVLKKFEQYENYENIKLPDQFTFVPNKNLIKSNTSEKRFKALVKKAKNYIKKGDIFQVVLSQRFERKIFKKPIEIYNHLRRSNPSPFMFYFNYEDFNVLGSSPEILVRLRKGEVTIRPIAGTRPRGRTSKEDKKQKGITTFMVDTKKKGIDVKKIDTLGHRSIGTTQVFYNDVEVSKDDIIGEIGGGWQICDSCLWYERLCLSAARTGAASACFDLALQYAKSREQFDRPIGKFQAISHKLADMKVMIELSRLLFYKFATSINEDKASRHEAAILKLYTSESYTKITEHAMQIYGGYGFCMEYPIQRFFRDARLSVIGAGTSEIQRNIIAKSIGL